MLTLPEFDTYNTLKRFAEDQSVESKLAFHWLRRTALNSITWHANELVDGENLENGVYYRIGAISEIQQDKAATEDIANMSEEEQREDYLNACKAAGVEIDESQLPPLKK